ncbi:MAG TPA: tRNA-(ms[2]io[6]A)-hydroxylase [Cellvibrionaceae bacterium]
MDSPLPTRYCLRYATQPLWIEVVLANLDHFLLDHAAAEKKASGMAMSMVSHYPDKTDIVLAMVDLALEELAHFKQVVKIIVERGLMLGADSPDPYVNQLRALHRKGSDVYLLDRLLIASIVEARGCERFGLIATHLPEGPLKHFYRAICDSEARHEDLFLGLALQHFEQPIVMTRLDELLDKEAAIVAALPIRAALH